MKPIIKWAGGKTQLLPTFLNSLPSNVEQLTTYVEPFIGGGAFFLNLLENNFFDKYIINDINSKLINLYITIRDDVELLIMALTEIKNTYTNLTDDEKKEMYYELRDKFNSDDIGKIDLAASFIFLNKTCFNGLYRENSKGKFNVPIGSFKKTPDIFNADSLRYLSSKLNEKDINGNLKVTILNKSFEQLEEFIDEQSFVYIDPPYRPITKGGFNAYDKSGFNDESQKVLANYFAKLSKKGSYIMLSNSDPKNLNEQDEFFDELYKDFNIRRTFASRSINSKSTGRGKISELLITNYNYD